MKKFLGILLVVVFLSSCITSTSVTIESSEPNTEISIDGRYVGETPLTVDIGNEAWIDYKITASKDGFTDVTVPVEKEVKLFNGFIGLFVFMPSLFWAWGPKDYQYIEMY